MDEVFYPRHKDVQQDKQQQDLLPLPPLVVHS